MDGKSDEAARGGADLIGLEDADAMPRWLERELAGLEAAARAAERLGRWWALPDGVRRVAVEQCRGMEVKYATAPLGAAWQVIADLLGGDGP